MTQKGSFSDIYFVFEAHACQTKVSQDHKVPKFTFEKNVHDFHRLVTSPANSITHPA